MTTATTTEFDQRWQSWRAERERWARQPLGWLSLTGLYWLDYADQSFEGVPGRWRSDRDNVYVTVASGELTFDGEPIVESAVLTPGEGAPGLEVHAGARIVEIIRRSGQFALRVHDPAAPSLAAFTEIPTYQPDPRWVLTADFEPYETAQVVTTGAVVDGLQHHHVSAGTVRFRLDDAEYRLIAFGNANTGLHLLFTDATSGDTTYPGARRLDLGRPAADGTLALDFNRAANLPCAFTDYATCPVAPARNRLPVAVEAGEKDPGKDHTA
ncbi:DUF1684 domain-containing protein [Nocardia sp. NPDC050406]|uniref:DUF1684 domain-containing protein n=1 Tax=Nocardia sp. NPDC050406 TaxID=3364318 RepID=UPI0037B6B6DE